MKIIKKRYITTFTIDSLTQSICFINNTNLSIAPKDGKNKQTSLEYNYEIL